MSGLTLESLWSLYRKLSARVMSSVARGVVSRTDDTKKVQRFQAELLADETEEDVEHFQPQGVSFCTQPGAEFIALAVGGSRAHTVALCAQDPAKRPTSGKPGTGGLYKDKKFFVFIDSENITHLGEETAEDFIAMAQKTKDQFDELRTRIDDLTTAHNTLRTDFTTFGAHTHIVATAMGPATAAPVIPPLVPVAPIAPPLGPAKDVKTSKAKAS